MLPPRLPVRPALSFKELSLLFGSRAKAQEILCLLDNAKPAVRQGFYDEELPKIEKFCSENQLFLVRSRFKVLLADGEEGYSNKGLRVAENDRRRGMHFVYISKDETQAWLASYYELIGNDGDLGKVLGYPECCVDFFCRNFNAGNADLAHPPNNAFTNLAKREQDLVLLSHFPCGSDCSESIALGKRYLEAIMKNDKNQAEELLRGLRVNPTA